MTRNRYKTLSDDEKNKKRVEINIRIWLIKSISEYDWWNQYQNMTDEKKQKIKEYGKNIDKIGLKKANKKTNNTWKNPKNYASNLLKNKRKQCAKNVLM